MQVELEVFDHCSTNRTALAVSMGCFVGFVVVRGKDLSSDSRMSTLEEIARGWRGTPGFVEEFVEG